MQTHGYIFDIKKFSVNDGPGIRTTVFFKGCPLTCWWCHNPESQRELPEKIDGCTFRWNFSNSASTAKIVGSRISVNDVMNEIKKDIPFYEESKGGATISGGEPMLQKEFLYSLLSSCKQNDINTAIDTTGYAPFEDFEKIYELTDIFLYDLKLIDEAEHLNYCGIPNSLIHENLTRLAEIGNKIILRVPVIPSITDTEKNISSMIELISKLKNVREIDLLPYHSSANKKYEQLNRENKINQLTPPANEYMLELKNRFEQLNIPIKIGG